MKLDGMEASQLEPLFVRWPASGITFPAFVALLRTQFGRVLGIECAALACRSCASLRTPTDQRLIWAGHLCQLCCRLPRRYVYHDEVKKVQELELKLHKEMLARQGQQREEEQKAKELERERLRQEVINEMRQQQLAQLAEIKNEVGGGCRRLTCAFSLIRLTPCDRDARLCHRCLKSFRRRRTGSLNLCSKHRLRRWRLR